MNGEQDESLCKGVHLLPFHFHRHYEYPFQGRQRKALSTCGSHLTAVTMFDGSLFGCISEQQISSLLSKGKLWQCSFCLFVFVCLFVCFCEFMLNPFMYTLRKNIVKQPLRRVFMRNFHAMKKSSIQQFPNGKKRVSKNKIVFLGGCS